jgi:hypothetical protein
MECQNARPLIPSYLDGELTEAQAAPLRKHLLDCQPCRASAQGEKNMKRWFVEPAAVAIPRDFAARVARRAFAEAAMEAAGGLAAPLPAHAATYMPGPSLVTTPQRGGTSLRAVPKADERNLRFVLSLTAVAAAVLVMLSIGIRSMTLPAGAKLMADDHKTLSYDQALQDLDQLNHREAIKSEVQNLGLQNIGQPNPAQPKNVTPKRVPPADRP